MDDATRPPQRGHAPLPQGQHRASDQDREATAERLRAAAGEGRLDLDELDERLGLAYRARTYAELAPLTRDLPADAGVAHQSATASVVRSFRVGGRPTVRQSWAVMGGANRRGHWVVPAEYVAVSIMGGVELDLTQATLAEHRVTIRAVALMGGVDVVVPPDVHVEVDGVGLLGSFEEGRADYEPPPRGAPVVRVTGVALMGGVSVRRPRRRRDRASGGWLDRGPRTGRPRLDER